MINSPAKYDTLAVPGGGTILAAVHPENGKLYFSPKHVCIQLDMGWPAQRVKIMADPVLAEGVSKIDMPSDGGMQSNVMLPVEMLSGWLTTIRKTRDAAKREALNAYRREAYAVLDAWFRKGGRTDTSSEMFAMMKETMEQMQSLHREALDMNRDMKPKAEYAELTTNGMKRFYLGDVARYLGIGLRELRRQLVRANFLVESWAGETTRFLPTEDAKKNGYTVPREYNGTKQTYIFDITERGLEQIRYIVLMNEEVGLQ